MLPFDVVLVLGKHIGEDPERNTRELRARAAAAAAAWRHGARLVGTLEAHLWGHRHSGSTLCRELLRELDLPDEAIYTRDWTHSTREEAVRGTAWFREVGARAALVLTGDYHLDRARRLFAEAGARASVLSPEAMWRFASERERAWIAAGAPTPEVRAHEGRVEARWGLLEGLVRPLPASLRADLEIEMGRRYRRHRGD